jgi:hypothetical protein
MRPLTRVARRAQGGTPEVGQGRSRPARGWAVLSLWGALFLALSAAAATAETLTFRRLDGKGAPSETDDCEVSQATPTTNYNSSGELNIDSDSGHFHTLVKFPNIFGTGVNQIPPGSTITSATLGMFIDNGGAGGALCPSVYQLVESWTETEVTWNSRQTAVSWTNPGADGTTSRKAVAEGLITCTPADTTGTIDVTTSVQNWSDGEPNEGWVMVDNDSDGTRFYTSEESTSSRRPILTVTFTTSVTAVRLASFTGRGMDGAALLEWETASELDNLGFHLYRAVSPLGPWTRLNESLIPGLGSSPEGRRYSWTDAGLVNGTTYSYRLEDVDRRARATSHGPLAVTPQAGASVPGDGGGDDPEGGGSGGGGGGGGGGLEPAWTPHGEPGQVSLRVVERSGDGVTLELVTGGFYSVPRDGGSTKLLVPGFFDHDEPGRPSVPTRRLWTEVPVGRDVGVVSVEPSDFLSFDTLRVPLAGRPVAVGARDGTYRAGSLPVPRREVDRRSSASSGPQLFPASLARVRQTAFQVDRKKAYVELAPLRVDEATGRVVLARRLVVRLAFHGRVAGEAGQGDVGRRPPASTGDGSVRRSIARLATFERGIHAVTFAEIPALAGPVPVASLRLDRLGHPVAFHVEPPTGAFGPGSTLYFLGEGTADAYANESVYELSLGSGGIRMAMDVVDARRAWSPARLGYLRHEATFEQDRVYLPALVEARDVWTWDYGLGSTQGQDYPFSLTSPLLAPGSARLTVDLQGGSDTGTVPDHHVRLFLNGSPVAETSFDGMVPHSLGADVPTSLLADGVNTLRVENVGDTGSAVSFVYLDRFSLEYPRGLSPVGGIVEGTAPESGRAGVETSPGSVLLDVTDSAPRWLGGPSAAGRLAWHAEAGHRYLAAGPEALHHPEVRAVTTAGLRLAQNQADWIAVAPRELLPALSPLLAHRQGEGLSAMAVGLEDVVSEFGHGEAGPHAVREFLAYAFHRWTAPSPRYVLLVGEATFDPKGRLAGTATSRPDLVPTPITKSTFLWTASDPAYAAVNGDDSLPDLAIGRLNAATLDEATDAVRKILDFEASGQSLDGKAVLVADNPDDGGDFEQDLDEVATLMPGRPVQKIYLTRYASAAAASADVVAAFDSGASLVSYAGHGSAGLWASEGLLRSGSVASFAPQPRQPFVLTFTCSNGYFLSPYSNSISERLVLAPDKGAIAAFSPSGLSLNDAAHVFHQALVFELQQGAHARLGDLVLAAQAGYAASGAFPELLGLYHLFGDPALRVR